MDKEWFSKWFNRDYLALYAHRSLEEAELQVEFLLRHLPARFSNPVEGSSSKLTPAKVLDVGCGNGRHLYHLSKRGIDSIGLDLSAELLSEASKLLKDSSPRPALIHGDMREIPLKDRSIALVTNFFTAFGYFSSDQEHEALLREWHRVLRPEGFLFLDYLNSSYVEAHLQPISSSKIDDTIVDVRRVIVSKPNRRIEKTITIRSTPPRVYSESVRLFTQDEIRGLFEAAGFVIAREFGDYDGSRPASDSPKHLILAEVTK